MAVNARNISVKYYEIKQMKIIRISILLLLCCMSVHVYADSSETTQDLNGTVITYLYTSGRSYNVKFEDDVVSYRYLTGTKPDVWWGPFPYQAIKVEKNLYFASWFEEAYGDYVTLLINFNENILHGSALISGNEVHLHSAELVKVEINERD